METAKVLNQIDPDFIRLRTLKVLKTMLLYKKIETGEFIPLSDDEIVLEERLLIETFGGNPQYLCQRPHPEPPPRGGRRFPEEKEKMLAVIDRYLALSESEKENFRLGRRGGVYRSLEDLSKAELRPGRKGASTDRIAETRRS